MSFNAPDNAVLPDTLQFELLGKDVNIKFNELDHIKKLGEGSFSVVHLMRDPKTTIEFAVKMFQNVSKDAVRDILKDIEIGKSYVSKFKTTYYGGLQQQFTIWIVMEPMDFSVKTFYTKIKTVDSEYRFPGIVLGYFAYASVHALEDLHVQRVIHRDVKPSNMLIDKFGKFKICDFGISGKLKDSLVQSAVGCNAYLAPERIDPKTCNDPFTIISDVWSLGISILEIAEMEYPFSKSLMNQLNDIVNKPPPTLSEHSQYHKDFPQIKTFLSHTIVKSKEERSNYKTLKTIEFLKQFDDIEHLENAVQVLSGIVKHYGE